SLNPTKKAFSKFMGTRSAELGTRKTNYWSRRPPTLAGCIDGSHGNRHKFVCFSNQAGNFWLADFSAFGQKFKPIATFIRFFFDDRHLVDEIGIGLGAF